MPARHLPRRSERHDAQIATVCLLVLALFGARIAGLHDAGSVELVAVAVAAWWFGAEGALWTAGASAALLVAATVVVAEISVGGLVVNVGLIGAGGWLLGWIVDGLRRQSEQLRRAEPVQNALAPSLPPDLPLLDVATRYVPAESAIGGDFYLVTEGHNNATIVVIADVVGKGVEAAKRATFVRATMSASGGYSQDPAHLLRIANAELVRQYGLSAQFITMLCAVIRPDATLSWCTAGHPPPLSLADGSPVGEAKVSLPLGIAPDLEEIDVWRGSLPSRDPRCTPTDSATPGLRRATAPAGP